MRRVSAVIAFSCVLGAGAAQAFPIAAPGTGGLVVTASGGEVIATYLGNSAAFSNDLYLVTPTDGTADDIFVFNNHASPVGATANLGTFSPGTELMFRLHVNNTGDDFFTGPASRNPDSNAHARVQADFETAGTTLVSFEDLFNGPFEYNDLSFSFTNTTSSGTPVPEPSPLLLMLAGIGLIGVMARLRRA